MACSTLRSREPKFGPEVLERREWDCREGVGGRDAGGMGDGEATARIITRRRPDLRYGAKGSAGMARSSISDLKSSRSRNALRSGSREMRATLR